VYVSDLFTHSDAHGILSHIIAYKSFTFLALVTSVLPVGYIML